MLPPSTRVRSIRADVLGAGAGWGSVPGAAAHPRTVWLFTAGLSCVLHGVGILVGGSLITRLDPGGPRLATHLAGLRVEDDDLQGIEVEQVAVDLDLGTESWAAASRTGNQISEELARPTSAAERPRPIPEMSSRPPTAPAPPLPVVPTARGDQRHLSNRPAPPNPVPSPRPAQDLRAAAPDRRGDRGARLEAWAFRRDTSTAHERLSDGADTYQPPHDLTRPHLPPASPEAVRRERETAEGDAIRTSFLQAPAPAPNYAAPDPEPAPDAPSSRTTEGAPNDTSATVSPDSQDPRGPRFTPLDSTGPLDADHGARAFDVAARRPRSSDDLALRAASHELHPGVTDLSRAAAPGDGELGRGPSLDPGGSPRLSHGAAAAIPKAHGVVGGTGDEDSLRARTYNRYELEIRRRVHDAYAFPKDLALRMEQGETIVRFTVAPDGRLVGAAQIVKSSGFEGFDHAALDAVSRAQPFRPIPEGARAKPLVFSVWFRAANPVVP